MSYNTVDAAAPVIKIVVGKDNQDSVPPHLTLNKDSVTTEETKGLHGVVRQRNDRVVIVDGIGNTVKRVDESISRGPSSTVTKQGGKLGRG